MKNFWLNSSRQLVELSLYLVKYVVPHGSLLGPLLFLLYRNDLKSAISCRENYEIILYADDTNNFVACKSLESAKIVVNKILSDLNSCIACSLSVYSLPLLSTFYIVIIY